MKNLENTFEKFFKFSFDSIFEPKHKEKNFYYKNILKIQFTFTKNCKFEKNPSMKYWFLIINNTRDLFLIPLKKIF